MVKLVNRAKMSTATTGTGTITLGSAVDGFQTFAAAGIANSDVVRYAIEDEFAWEVGTGTYTASGTTLTRTVIESSNGDAALNLSGNALVFLTVAGGDLQHAADMDQSVATTDSPSFAGLTATTADINGGTIDGTVIGGSTPAAISGTTGSFSGDVSITDKIVHTGDTNTAIRFPGNDTVTVETGGSEAMRITSAGRVGIGTTAPETAFHAVGGSILESFINLTGTSPTLNIAETDDGAAHRIIADGGNLFIQADGTGSVSNSGNLYITGRTGADLSFLEIRSDLVTIESNGSEAMRIDSSGNVGIGTTNPLVPLSVVGDIRSTRNLELGTEGVNATCYITQERSSVRTLWGPLTTRALFGTTSNHDVAFLTNNTEAMRITSSGNVGIGTSSPATKLTVVGGATSGGVDNAALFLGGVAGVVGSGSEISLSGGAGANRAAAIRGINTNGAGNAHDMVFLTSASTSSPSEAMRITDAGNVLIGTSFTGASKLRVVGLPTSSAGLSTGDIYNDGGTLKIA